MTFFLERLPRGIRNNNPGNIRLSPTRWAGQKPVQQDTAFVEFADPLHGLRALMRILLTYHLKYKRDTIESIINRFAPPVENDSGVYIRQVCKKIGLGARVRICLLSNALLIRLARAIACHENGKAPKPLPPDWYEDDLYRQAADIALKTLNERKNTCNN